MKKILLMKTGSTLPPIRAARGDFEVWIARGMGIPLREIDVVCVHEGERLPAPDAAAGVVVTGSPAMVSAREPWSERAADWLAAAVAARTPIFGICYGHQLLAHGLGGEVAANPKGREMGTVPLRLTPDAGNDPLLGGLASRLPVHTTHVESVIALPEGARLLGGTELDPNQAFAVGDRAWGVQFHPEFDADVMRGYVDFRRGLLADEGLDPDALRGAVVETPASNDLLARFARLAAGRRPRFA